MAKREAVDRERLRQALEKSTSTEHVLVPNWKRSENEQQSQLRRGRVPAPRGRKLNDSNNKKARQQNTLVRSTKATDEQSGVGIRTREAFGVKPVSLL
jgi:hypothetical protein